MIEPTRRGFIGGMAALFAAPVIVRASSLMPVRALPLVGAFNLPAVTEELIDFDMAKYAREISFGYHDMILCAVQDLKNAAKYADGYIIRSVEHWEEIHANPN